MFHLGSEIDSPKRSAFFTAGSGACSVSVWMTCPDKHIVFVPTPPSHPPRFPLCELPCLQVLKKALYTRFGSSIQLEA